MVSNEHKTVALYARVSTTDQSCEPQLADLRRYAAQRFGVVVFDTTGYFNEADDPGNYQQALSFGQKVFNLLTTGKARAVIGLYRPPKYQGKEETMSLENMLLGSAGCGGILRSCLGVLNLNHDLDDPNVWLLYWVLQSLASSPSNSKDCRCG